MLSTGQPEVENREGLIDCSVVGRVQGGEPTGLGLVPGVVGEGLHPLELGNLVAAVDLHLDRQDRWVSAYCTEVSTPAPMPAKRRSSTCWTEPSTCGTSAAIRCDSATWDETSTGASAS